MHTFAQNSVSGRWCGPELWCHCVARTPLARDLDDFGSEEPALRHHNAGALGIDDAASVVCANLAGNLARTRGAGENQMPVMCVPAQLAGCFVGEAVIGCRSHHLDARLAKLGEPARAFLSWLRGDGVGVSDKHNNHRQHCYTTSNQGVHGNAIRSRGRTVGVHSDGCASRPIGHLFFFLDARLS